MEVPAPNDLLQALRSADEAGDAEAASRIATIYDNHYGSGGPAPAPAPVEEAPVEAGPEPVGYDAVLNNISPALGGMADDAVNVVKEAGAGIARGVAGLGEFIANPGYGMDAGQLMAAQAMDPEFVPREMERQEEAPYAETMASDEWAGKDYMEEGLPRDIVQFSSELIPYAVSGGGIIRGAVTGLAKHGSKLRYFGGGTALDDALNAAYSATGSVLGGEGAAELFGEDAKVWGELAGGILTPFAGSIAKGAAGRRTLQQKQEIEKLDALSKRSTSQLLKDEASPLYKTVDNYNHTFTPQRMANFHGNLKALLDDPKMGYNKHLHGAVKTLLKALKKDGQDGLSPSQVRAFRKAASDLTQGKQPWKKRMGGLIRDELDNLMDDVPALGEANRQAIKLSHHAFKTEEIEKAVIKAANSERGLTATTMRQNLRGLLNDIDTGKKTGWTEAETEALRAVVRPGKSASMFNWLGQFTLTSVPGVGATGGALMAIGPGALAVPAVAAGARGAGKKIVEKGVQGALDTTSMGRAPSRYPATPADSYVTDMMSGIRAGVIGQNIPE